MRLSWNTRGMYFTLDAFFGSLIIVSAVILYLSFSQYAQDPAPLQTTAVDAVRLLNTLTVEELNASNATLGDQLVSTGLVSVNDTALRAIGVLWATNNSLAPPLTAEVLRTFLPQYSYAIYAETDKMASVEYVPESQAKRIASAKQQISGIAYNKPVTGTTATAFLRKIENKTTSSYVYFGGFVGQGNLSFVLTDLPADISQATIHEVVLEVDTGSPFTLYINGTDCGYFTPSNAGNTTVERWVVSTCHDQFQSGTTGVELRLNSSIDFSYVAGGYLRVSYVTQYETVDPYVSPQVVHLPGIEGIVNLYDSFFVPGNVTSMQVRLHYFANHSGALQNNSFYLTIGNTTVYRENFSTTTQNVLLTDVNLTALNYTAISQATVPFRIGFENLSFSTIYSGNADVGLVTDVSGSMDFRMDQNGVDGTARSCSNPQINNSDTRRLSVAKCLDSQFAHDILNLSGNRLALVSYDSSTNGAQTVPLTTNVTIANNTITAYVAGSSTCICCGINSIVTELSQGLTRTTLLASGAANWRYNFTAGVTQAPGADPSANPWYALTYSNESQWATGTAVLGSNANGSGPTIVTDMGNSLSAVALYPDLWDNANDTAIIGVDFTSPLNATGNSFGIGGADDGWDWQGGTYGYDNDFTFSQAVGGELEMQIGTVVAGNNRNNCNSNDCSGAYGVEFNITPTMWATLQANGQARLSFTYTWNSPLNNVFASQDEVWVKARLTNSSGQVTYLGTEQSSVDTDNTVEIARVNDPDTEVTHASYTQDITTYITGPGSYYFDFGGKLFVSNGNANKWGYFRFDDLLMTINNQTDVYYLRRAFTIANLSQAQTAILNVLSDDRTTVYLNGQQVYDEPLPHVARYWNIHGTYLPQDLLIQGQNVLAVRLENIHGTTQFDARIEGINTAKSLAALVMTDGQANVECLAQGSTPDLNQNGTVDDAVDDMIAAACQARENWGITLHTVGFSTTADTAGLQYAAQCAGGLSTTSANTTDLSDFYKNVAQNILDGSLKSQSIVLNSSFQPSVLYNDSYLSFTHTPAYPALRANEVTVRTQSAQFATCAPSVFLNPAARVLSAELTSYSGDHWTDLVTANGQTVYNLSRYTSPYIVLGDPYIVHVPPSVLVAGSNSLLMRTGDSPTNSSGCSLNNSLITTLGIQLSTSYTPVLSLATGCTWTIEHDDLTTQVVSVPSTYTGGNTCSYTNTSISYNTNDAYDVGTFGLLQSLDYDSDGRIFISLAEEDIEIIVNTVSNVPYLWGPSLFEVRVWQ